MTNRAFRGIIIKRLREQVCGGVAQLARATGSYPVGHGFKSNLRYHRPVGQAAKTPPFHGGNGSSILPRVTKKETSEQNSDVSFFISYWELNAPTVLVRRRFAVLLCKTTALAVEQNSELSEAKHILPRVTKNKKGAHSAPFLFYPSRRLCM